MAPDGERIVAVHAVVAASAPPPAAEGPALPGGGPARAVPLEDGLWLLLSEIAASPAELEAALEDLDRVSACALAHERIVESGLAWGTVLPLKLFTFFSDEERARADLLANRDGLRAAADRVRGAREWGIRVRIDPERLGAERARRVDTGPVSGGAEFLRRKAADRTAARELAARAREEAEAVYVELRERARAGIRREVPEEPGARLVLDAVLLVEDDARSGFEAALQGAGTRVAAACAELVVTGPWPAYHFAATGGADDAGRP